MKRQTNIWQKLLPSLINVALVLALSSPFLVLWGFDFYWKVLVIGIFFIYSFAVAVFNENRCLGMILTGSCWQHRFSFKDKLLYATLYSLSFATLFVWVFFPFDLLLLNLLLIQLPFIFITGTTAHGYLAGQNVTMAAGH